MKKNIYSRGYVYTKFNAGNFGFGQGRCQMVIRVGENFLESCKAKGEEFLPDRILFSLWLLLSRFLTILAAFDGYLTQGLPAFKYCMNNKEIWNTFIFR